MKESDGQQRVLLFSLDINRNGKTQSKCDETDGTARAQENVNGFHNALNFVVILPVQTKHLKITCVVGYCKRTPLRQLFY